MSSLVNIWHRSSKNSKQWTPRESFISSRSMESCDSRSADWSPPVRKKSSALANDLSSMRNKVNIVKTYRKRKELNLVTYSRQTNVLPKQELANIRTLDGIINSIANDGAMATGSEVILDTYSLISSTNSFFARLIAKHDEVEQETDGKEQQARILVFISKWIMTLKEKDLQSIKGTMYDFFVRIKDAEEYESISLAVSERQQSFARNKKASQLRNEKEKEIAAKQQEYIDVGQAIPTAVQQILGKVRLDNFKSSLLINFSPIDIAQLITREDVRKLGQIDTTCLVSYLTGSDNIEKLKCSVIEEYFEWCDMITQWVASEICFNSKIKSRTTCISLFVQVAQELIKMHNINGFNLVMEGLSHPSAIRMKKTYELSDSVKTFRELFESIQQHPDYENYIHMDAVYIPSAAVCRNKLVAALKMSTYTNERELNYEKLEIVSSILTRIRLAQTEFKLSVIEIDEACGAYFKYLPVLPDRILSHYSNLFEPSKETHSNTMLLRYKQALKLLEQKRTGDDEYDDEDFDCRSSTRSTNGYSQGYNSVNESIILGDTEPEEERPVQRNDSVKSKGASTSSNVQPSVIILTNSHSAVTIHSITGDSQEEVVNAIIFDEESRKELEE